MAEWKRHLLMSCLTLLLVEGEIADLEEGPVAEKRGWLFSGWFFIKKAKGNFYYTVAIDYSKKYQGNIKYENALLPFIQKMQNSLYGNVSSLSSMYVVDLWVLLCHPCEARGLILEGAPQNWVATSYTVSLFPWKIYQSRIPNLCNDINLLYDGHFSTSRWKIKSHCFCGNISIISAIRDLRNAFGRERRKLSILTEEGNYIDRNWNSRCLFNSPFRLQMYPSASSWDINVLFQRGKVIVGHVPVPVSPLLPQQTFSKLFTSLTRPTCITRLIAFLHLIFHRKTSNENKCIDAFSCFLIKAVSSRKVLLCVLTLPLRLGIRCMCWNTFHKNFWRWS